MTRELSGQDTGYGTPIDFFKELELEFGKFDLDAAADEVNTLCQNWYDEKADGLKQPWLRRTFVNPPYNPAGTVKRWIEKAIQEQAKGKFIVMLLNVDSSTTYFHESLLRHAEVRLYHRRFNYRYAKSGAKKPGMICIFRPPMKRKFCFHAIGNIGGVAYGH